MTTNRLYYQDAYTSEFEAQVVETRDDGKRVYLDRTYFYPTSGGQPHDTGFLNGVSVTDVVDEGDRVAHILAEALSEASVQAHLNWDRRLDHMQQHSGQHLLSAVLLERFGMETLSFHMSADVSTIELGAKELSAKQVETAEEQANEIIRSALQVTISFEDASAVQALRKESKRTGLLRVVEISKIDRSACGGTHVRNTAEIGSVQIRGAEKVRGNVRIEFVCGVRALRQARRDFAILSDLSRRAAVPADQLVESFDAVRQRLLEAERDRDKLRLQVAKAEGERLYRDVRVAADGIRRLYLAVGAIDESARLTAIAFTTNPKAVCLIATAENAASVLVSCSADSGVDAGALIKKVIAARGGRGGGSVTLAQAKLQDAESVVSLKSSLGFADSV